MRILTVLTFVCLMAFAGCGKSVTSPTDPPTPSPSSSPNPSPSPSLPPPPSPPPTPEPFPAWRMNRADALNWMLGHRPDGVWLDSEEYYQGTGGHGMIPVLEGSQGSGEFIWLKLRTGNNYERFTYDAGNIYWREDHGYNGQYISYTWTNVRWLPRNLAMAGYIENTENRIHWHNTSTCEVGVDNHYPVYVTFHGYESLNQGGDTGTMDVIHVSFQVSASPYTEHYWYSWQWGWVRWEYRHSGETAPRAVSAFIHRGTGPAIPEEPCR